MSNRYSTIVVGSFMVNCYLYWDDATGDGVIIDPGDEGLMIVDTVQKAGFTPRGILLTHGHVDHIGAVAQVKEEFHLPLYVGRGDETMLADPAANASIMLDEPVKITLPEFVLEDEQEVKIGSLTLRVLATPGHTPGGVCYLDESEGFLFCGDTLFQGSIGRSDLPGGSLPQLLESIQEKLMRLPDEIICLPGHGPVTTIGAERNGNPFLIGGYFA